MMLITLLENEWYSWYGTHQTLIRKSVRPCRLHLCTDLCHFIHETRVTSAPCKGSRARTMDVACDTVFVFAFSWSSSDAESPPGHHLLRRRLFVIVTMLLLTWRCSISTGMRSWSHEMHFALTCDRMIMLLHGRASGWSSHRGRHAI